MDCDPHSDDSENIKQSKTSISFCSEKKDFWKVSNDTDRLLRGNSSEDFDFISEAFDKTYKYIKNKFLYIAVLGINNDDVTVSLSNPVYRYMQIYFDKSEDNDEPSPSSKKKKKMPHGITSSQKNIYK